LGVLPFEFARKLAPIAGFRKIMVLEYLRANWDKVYKQLGEVENLIHFGEKTQVFLTFQRLVFLWLFLE